MRARELLDILKEKPWKGLRLHFTGGERVDVRHPESIIVFLDSVGIVVRPDPDTPARQLVRCNLVHLLRVAPLNGANGHGKRQKRQ